MSTRLMSDRVDHLDFYPRSPETIAALQDMHVMDMPQEEIENHAVFSRREKAYVALLETSVAFGGASIGYLGYKAVSHSQKESSEKLPEMSLGIMAGFVVAAVLATGITRAWGAKTWERIKTATSRD